mgnify:CR=1 FL=1
MGPVGAGARVLLKWLPFRCSRAHLGATVLRVMGAVDQVESLHSFTLQGQSLHTGVISAINASLLALPVLGTNLMWYRPEIGISNSSELEVEGADWAVVLLLYARQ